MVPSPIPDGVVLDLESLSGPMVDAAARLDARSVGACESDLEEQLVDGGAASGRPARLSEWLTVGLSDLAMDDLAVEDLAAQTTDVGWAWLEFQWPVVRSVLAGHYDMLPWNGAGLKRYVQLPDEDRPGVVLDADLRPAGSAPGPDVVVVAVELVPPF